LAIATFYFRPASGDARTERDVDLVEVDARRFGRGGDHDLVR
jgi:hypothetical protein